MTEPEYPGLGPDAAELAARVRAELRAGVPVVLCDGPAGLLFAPAETVSERRIAALRGLGRALVAITNRRAETLKARCYDGDIARLALPHDAGCDWINALADPARDLMSPMKGPLIAERGGDASLFRLAVRLTKTARLLPAVVGVELSNAAKFAKQHAITLLHGADLQRAFDLRAELRSIVSAQVPLRASQEARLHIFRPRDGAEEHYAIEIGKPDRTAPVLARLHSACFTGDLLGSLKCDCGPQLRTALGKMGAEGAGILLYLNQEGRGIGLANKMRAYSLQDQGFDTVEANHRLGFEDDERDFRIGAAILADMGFARARLMTNNPAKVDMLAANGIEVVERVPLVVGKTDQNARYLATKAAKSGHLL